MEGTNVYFCKCVTPTSWHKIVVGFNLSNNTSTQHSSLIYGAGNKLSAQLPQVPTCLIDHMSQDENKLLNFRLEEV